jgi:hypothetical protein
MSTDTTATERFGVDPVPASCLATDQFVVTDCYEADDAVRLTVRDHTGDTTTLQFTRPTPRAPDRSNQWAGFCKMLHKPVENPFAVRGTILSEQLIVGIYHTQLAMTLAKTYGAGTVKTIFGERRYKPLLSAGERLVTDATFNHEHGVDVTAQTPAGQPCLYKLTPVEYAALCEQVGGSVREPRTLAGRIVDREALHTGEVEQPERLRTPRVTRDALWRLTGGFAGCVGAILLLNHWFSPAFLFLGTCLLTLFLGVFVWDVFGFGSASPSTASANTQPEAAPTTSSPAPTQPTLDDLREQYVTGALSEDEYEQAVETALAATDVQ